MGKSIQGDGAMISEHPFISVIIPVYNNSAPLEECLRSLENQSYPRERYEIVVVDNASLEDIGAVVRHFAGVSYAYEARRGPAAARNKGIGAAQGEVIAFTDSDCLPAKEWLEKGAGALLGAPGCGLAAGRIDISYRNPKRPTAVELYSSNYFKQKKNVETDHFGATANVFTFRRVFDKVGYFDEIFDVPGSEDREWGERVFQAGFGIVYSDDAVVTHPARSTLGELYRKIVESRTGYYYYENLKNGNGRDACPSPASELVSLFRPPFRSAFRLMGSVKGPWRKLKLYFVILFAYYARVWVSIRLGLGWRPDRMGHG